LIENAAIHDSAWLLDMPKAQKFTPLLVKICKGSLTECKMVNTHEYQTRIFLFSFASDRSNVVNSNWIQVLNPIYEKGVNCYEV
jgi:hypothetical protein